MGSHYDRDPRGGSWSSEADESTEFNVARWQAAGATDADLATLEAEHKAKSKNEQSLENAWLASCTDEDLGEVLAQMRAAAAAQASATQEPLPAVEPGAASGSVRPPENAAVVDENEPALD